MKARSAQLLIRFGYDGSHFHGVQPQAGLPTAGGALLQRIQDAFGPVTIHALSFAARTDAGVHADANLASCRITSESDFNASFEDALAEIAAARDDGLLTVQAFHYPRRTLARAIANGKHYRYNIESMCAAPDLSRKCGAWQVAPALDVEGMRLTAQTLIGAHDFSAYACRKATGSRVKTVHAICLERVGNRVVIDIHGTGFLRYMVRYIVGHLAAIGAGLEEPSATSQRLNSKTLPARAMRAPADGLRLLRIDTDVRAARHQQIP